MTNTSAKSFARRIREAYPDCPQRDVALHLVRQGHMDQAQAWLDALDDLRQRGQSTLFGSTEDRKTG